MISTSEFLWILDGSHLPRAQPLALGEEYALGRSTVSGNFKYGERVSNLQKGCISNYRCGRLGNSPIPMHLSSMWLSVLAPLGKVSRFPGILCNGKCSLRRSSTQSFGKDARRQKRWTAEENRKLENLVKQGLKLSGMANEMKGRTYSAIEQRAKKLRMGLTLRDEKTGGSFRIWSAEEDALMLEKLEQGLTPLQLKGFFPGRTYASVSIHTQRLRVWYTGQQDKLKTNSGPLIQRIIDMRVKEAKNVREIASELGIKQKQVTNLWETRCVKMVSKEMLDQLHLQKNWSPKEIEHILELHRRATLCSSDAVLHFPSKTPRSFQTKCSRMQLRWPLRSQQPEVSVPIKFEESSEQ